MSSRLGSDASDRYQVLEEPYNTPDSYRPTTPEANPQPDPEAQYALPGDEELKDKE